jgi:hypothetical protein
MKHTTQATVTCAECGDRHTLWAPSGRSRWQPRCGRRRTGVPHTMVGQWRSGLTGREPAKDQRDRAAGSDTGGNLGAHQVSHECRSEAGTSPSRGLLGMRSAGELWQATAPGGTSAASPGRARYPPAQPSTRLLRKEAENERQS